MSLFEISGDDIALLNDADLRNLIGMLCEADYRANGISVAGIRYGGSQDAADGGIDVMVDGDFDPPKTGFVPRKTTGFQVKKPNMDASGITKEMKPKGKLRPKIKDLIRRGGAYIIISSGSSVTDTTYDARIKAMKEAVSAEKGHEGLHVDFFDRGRIASWVRGHPAMILWARKRIGKEVRGWQPYGDWTKTSHGTEGEYILDDKLRLFDGAASNGVGLSVKDGISLLRQQLSEPGTSIRLAGLSGVGKTRLVQALFDGRIGENPLNPYLACYTDISDGPSPDPRSFAEQLALSSQRAIIIIDNCNPELHRKMTQCCKGTNIGLLTVEYDIRDDLPEETSVFRLQTASPNVIEEIILRRFPHIGRMDAMSIAKFSDGNARIAIALANTLKKGDTLSGFKDEGLFERLFWQRRTPDDHLLRAAEVCSLLYSFEGVETGETSELGMLASLAGMPTGELFRRVKELRDRELVQSRGKWRAVLPHAIANRLAGRALETIPKSKLVDTILHSGERVIKSFTRRLGYLHDSGMAVEIVSGWLSPDGLIGSHISGLNDLGISIFQNIAPVCPKDALKIMEGVALDPDKGAYFYSRKNPRFYEFARILRHLAYERDTFRRSALLLARIALSEREGERYDSVRDLFRSLFHARLSGTQATVGDRADFVEKLLGSDSMEEQKMGLLALGAALETGHFVSHHESSGFGARPRDFGYEPRTLDEIQEWFGAFIGICTAHILSGKPSSPQAKKLLETNMRGLWTNAWMFDELERSVALICKDQKSWGEAWIATGRIIHFDGKKLPQAVQDRLAILRKKLEPQDLEGMARTYALSDQNLLWDLEEEEDERPSVAHKRMEDKTRLIAQSVVQDTDLLDRILPDLVSTNNSRLYNFGQGIANGCDDKKALWDKLYAHIESLPEDRREINLLLGFMGSCAQVEPDLYHVILDRILGDGILGKWFPLFQMTSDIDKKGVERLHKSLDGGMAKIDFYGQLWAQNTISDNDLAGLLDKILEKADGFSVSSEILKMRFHVNGDASAYSESLLKVARKTLMQCSFSEEKRGLDLLDHDLEKIARTCLTQQSGDEARAICVKIRNNMLNGRMSRSSLPRLLCTIAEKYPMVFLREFLESPQAGGWVLFSNRTSHDNPFNKIPDKVFIDWCEEAPESRYPLMADSIPLYKKPGGSERLVWKEVVHDIFERAPDLEPVLDNISRSIYPRVYTGSFANVLQTRLVLFEDLEGHIDPRVMSWAKGRLSKLRTEIGQERESENRLAHEEYEGFE